MASYEMNLTEIYNSDVYNNNKNTSETLEVSQISQATMPVFLRTHGYNVMCENNLNAEKLAEVKPMILYTCIDGGKSLNFNCVVDWDAFIDSGYTSITLTKRGVVADTGMNLLIKDIWHAVGLKEDLANYGANFFDSLAEDVQNEMLSRFLEMGVNYLQNIGGTEYNWASNTEFIPYLDVEDGEVKAKFYVPSQFYESIYDYIYDTYVVSGEIEYELHTASSTGTYTLTSPMRLTKDLFRKAFLNLAKANTINTHKYDWYLPDADDIYDAYLKPILDLNHYDTIYDYVNIMFKSGEDSLELSQCGEQAPTHVQIHFYNIQDNEISITNIKTHTDDAVIKYTGNTYVQVVDIPINYTYSDFSHQCGSDEITYNKKRGYVGCGTPTNVPKYHRMDTSAFEYGLGDALGTHNGLLWDSGTTWTGSFAYYGLSSCRYVEIEVGVDYFLHWKTPEPYTPRTTDQPGSTPVNPEPTTDDEPEPTDIPVPPNPRPRPIPPPIIKTIYPNLPIPPLPEPEMIVGVPPVRNTPTHRYNGMIKTWYTGEDEMDVVNGVLWQDSALAILSQLFKNNPLDCVLRFSELFVQPVEQINYDNVENIVLGKVDCGYGSASNVITNPYIEINLGQVQIPKYFNDFRDFSPYSTMKIYLPFVSWVNLNINDFVGHDLKLTATVNIITGDMVFHIIRVDANAEVEVNTVNGNCSNTLPLSANDRTSLVMGLVGAVGSLSYGNVIGAVGSLANAKEHTSQSGTLTGNIGAMCNKNPYIIVTRPCKWDDDAMYTVLGDTTNIVCNLGALSGYVKCKDIKLDGLNAPDEIKQYITDLCKSGVHIN